MHRISGSGELTHIAYKQVNLAVPTLGDVHMQVLEQVCPVFKSTLMQSMPFACIAGPACQIHLCVRGWNSSISCTATL